MSFTSAKKQRVCNIHAQAMSEFVRACLYEDDNRIVKLSVYLEARDVKASDIDLLLGIARDFVATYKLLPHPLKDALADSNKPSLVPLSEPGASN